MSDTRYQKLFPISWDQLHRDVRTLAARLLEHAPFKGIVAVTRGGLVPAAILARELDIRLIDTVCVSSYDWQNQRGCTVLKGIARESAAQDGAGANDLPSDGAGWLVVDDLADTGNTLKLLRQMLPKAHFAAIYAKPAGKLVVDTFITETSQDTWILLPWDSAVQYVPPFMNNTPHP